MIGVCFLKTKFYIKMTLYTRFLFLNKSYSSKREKHFDNLMISFSKKSLYIYMYIS